MVRMWQGRAQSQCGCGRGRPSPGADVAGAGPVPVQMWQGQARSRCRCGRGRPGPGADVAGAARSRCRCGRDGRASPVAASHGARHVAHCLETIYGRMLLFRAMMGPLGLRVVLQTWSSHLVSSSGFHTPGYQNPASFPFITSHSWQGRCEVSASSATFAVSCASRGKRLRPIN
jgi:hypothetical protein